MPRLPPTVSTAAALWMSLLPGCGAESTDLELGVDSTNADAALLPGATELFPTGVLDLNTNPKARIQDTHGVLWADSTYTAIPGALNGWHIAQWKKVAEITPARTAGAPKTSSYTDPVLGTPTWVYYAGPNAFSPGEESSIAAFKRPAGNFIYDLRATGGWLDVRGGANIFLELPLETGKVRSLDKPTAFTFNERMLQSAATAGDPKKLTDGTVLGQYFTGFISDNRTADGLERTTLFQQVRHANTTTPASDYGHCTLKQSTVNGKAATYSVVIYGYHFNDEPYFSSPNNEQKPVAYVLNRGVCRMLSKALTCEVETCGPNFTACTPKRNGDGSQVTQPLVWSASQKTMAAWNVTSLYHGFETEVAKGTGNIDDPVAAGLTPQGTVAMRAQVSALSLQRFAGAANVACSNGDMVGEVTGLSCTLDGAVVPEGAQRTVYDARSVLYGDTCAAHAQTARCKNGNFVSTAGTAIFRDLTGSCTQEPAQLGFFCSPQARDTLTACKIDPLLRGAMVNDGWSVQAANCYHHATTGSCAQANYDKCTGGKGAFCGGSTLTEYICGCAAPPPGWTSVGGGCFHRATTTRCLP